jgi:hypothetical protein
MNNLKAIQLSPIHYVVVDDSKIREGDWFYTKCLDNIFKASGFPLSATDAKKITHSTQPLEGVKHIPLSEVEEAIFGYSVEKMARVHKVALKDDWSESSYLVGFKAAQELSKDKMFTIEDIKKAFNAGDNYRYWENNGSRNTPSNVLDEEKYIQSVLPKTEWNVTFDEQGKLKLI